MAAGLLLPALTCALRGILSTVPKGMAVSPADQASCMSWPPIMSKARGATYLEVVHPL